jgi:hypothetical protein
MRNDISCDVGRIMMWHELIDADVDTLYVKRTDLNNP